MQGPPPEDEDTEPSAAPATGGGIVFLRSADERRPADGVFRAGGTDLQERLRTTGATPTIVDLGGVEGLTGIARSGTGTRIGAGTTIAAVAGELADDYPALAATAGGLATPQIRAVATVGGNLLQRTRCWYFRHPHLHCFKSGGDHCPARTGRHLYGVAFDTSECVHPHPSSMAMALLVYDARVVVGGVGAASMTVTELLGDGVDPRRDHRLPRDAILTAVVLPAPWPEERGAYLRSISRAEAEWPLVEAVGRARLDGDGRVAECGIAVGGVATVPLRMPAAEDIVRGSVLDAGTIARAAAVCTAGTDPLPETGYKVPLIEATVRQVLERLVV